LPAAKWSRVSAVRRSHVFFSIAIRSIKNVTVFIKEKKKEKKKERKRRKEI